MIYFLRFKAADVKRVRRCLQNSRENFCKDEADGARGCQTKVNFGLLKKKADIRISAARRLPGTTAATFGNNEQSRPGRHGAC